MIQQCLVLRILRLPSNLRLVPPNSLFQDWLQVRVHLFHCLRRGVFSELAEMPNPSLPQTHSERSLGIEKCLREAVRSTGRPHHLCGDGVVVRVRKVRLKTVHALTKEELRRAIQSEARDQILIEDAMISQCPSKPCMTTCETDLEIQGMAVAEALLHLLQGDVWRGSSAMTPPKRDAEEEHPLTCVAVEHLKVGDAVAGEVRACHRPVEPGVKAQKCFSTIELNGRNEVSLTSTSRRRR